MKMHGKVMVVTGGGSGMGQQLVLVLLERGARVAMADISEAGLRRTRELASVHEERLSGHVIDVTDREAVEALPARVIEAHGCVDGIINNAGIIQPFLDVTELEYAAIERVMNVNFFGALHMIRSFLPHLLARPEAHIGNVASMGGFFPFPKQTIYGASKAAIKLLTEGLFFELQDTPVRVSALYPGAVETNIITSSGVEMPTRAQALQARFKPLSPRKAAEIMIDGMERNRYRVMVGWDAFAMDLFSRMLPERAARLVTTVLKGLIY